MRLRLRTNNQPLGTLVLSETGQLIDGVSSAVWSVDAVGLPRLTITLEDFDLEFVSAAKGGQ